MRAWLLLAAAGPGRGVAAADPPPPPPRFPRSYTSTVVSTNSNFDFSATVWVEQGVERAAEHVDVLKLGTLGEGDNFEVVRSNGTCFLIQHQQQTRLRQQPACTYGVCDTLPLPLRAAAALSPVSLPPLAGDAWLSWPLTIVSDMLVGFNNASEAQSGVSFVQRHAACPGDPDKPCSQWRVAEDATTLQMGYDVYEHGGTPLAVLTIPWKESYRFRGFQAIESQDPHLLPPPSRGITCRPDGSDRAPSLRAGGATGLLV